MHIGLGFLAFILCLLFLSRPAAGGEKYVDKMGYITPHEADRRNNYDKGYGNKRNYNRKSTGYRSNSRKYMKRKH
jgi:hypothetical protein